MGALGTGKGHHLARGYFAVRAPKHPRANPSGHVRQHILVAEEALKKRLPKRAVIHHVNEIRDDNRNSNLVICQDQAYHLFLHRRLRAYKATGFADARVCSYCHQWSRPKKILILNDKIAWHRKCRAAYDYDRYHNQGINRGKSPT